MNRSPQTSRPIPVHAWPRAAAGGGIRGQASWIVRRAAAVVHGAAMLAVLLLSPSSYATPGARRAVVIRLYLATITDLVTFVLLSTGVSSVLVLLVATAAQSYGLSAFALEGIVRVLLLELIPLLAAVFVLVEVTLPGAALLALRRSEGLAHDRARERADQREHALRRAALPRAFAGMFVPLILCVIASWIALALAYLLLYGATPWALQGFGRVIGKVFDPVVGIVWTLKTMAFSVAVSLLPIAAALAPTGSRRPDPVDLTLTMLVRTGALLLLIELLALLGIYA